MESTLLQLFSTRFSARTEQSARECVIWLERWWRKKAAKISYRKTSYESRIMGCREEKEDYIK